MTRLNFLLLLVVAAGCTSPVQQRIPAVAIAIRPVGDRQPSAEEVRQTHQALRPALLRVGASLADSRDVAEFVMTVTFIPASGSSNSRVIVNGIEPTARFRDATDGGDTPEAKEWRQRMHEIEGWVQRQARTYEY